MALKFATFIATTRSNTTGGLSRFNEIASDSCSDQTVTRSVTASNNPITVTKTSTIYFTDTGFKTQHQVQSSTNSFMTIAVTNSYESGLSLSLASNVDSPTPIGNPFPAALPKSSSTEYTFPTGWAGRLCVGKVMNTNASKIEASFDGTVDVDVSYVDGYTVPIVCSSDGVPVTGCSIELFKQSGAPCEDLVDNHLCLNTARETPHGPPPPFFKACAGTAYTFPSDDQANQYNTSSNLISCCIGSVCKAPLRQLKDSAGRPTDATLSTRNTE